MVFGRFGACVRAVNAYTSAILFLAFTHSAAHKCLVLSWMQKMSVFAGDFKLRADKSPTLLHFSPE